MSDLNYRIEAALRRHGLSIPFPQRDLHLGSPDLSAIALAFARRHLGDAELAAARAALQPALARPGDDGEVIPQSACRVWTNDELRTIVARLRGASGLDIADRRHRLTVYPRSFVGREAVDWLARREGLTRAEALRFGELLVERGVIHHVLDEHPFRDADLFYRFRADDPAPAAARASTVSG